MRPHDTHPSRHHGPTQKRRAREQPPKPIDAEALIPPARDQVVLELGRRRVTLTHLQKVFWPELGLTKGDLLRYYARISPVLLPHLASRAMVMKRYPNGAEGEFFFMKRAPAGRPEFIETCSVEHASGNIIDFPIVQDLPSLLWLVNLGCIDLNQSYGRCDDMNRPDYLNFDLDPGPGVSFAAVREAALRLHEALRAVELPAYAKTSGSKGIHVYVPIERGPTQKQVWGFAKQMAQALASLRPDLITAEYKVAARPRGRVLVDYNQNAWGRTLASVYSVRPTPRATVSTPVRWEEIEAGVMIEDFRVDNVPARVAAAGDLFAPLLENSGRAQLWRLIAASS